ncbi:PRC-barrel domain protein [Symmachiella macrocystis]|uniref:PRC-barrel domain protein n=1 Tax=Symmachiella macrocystis TaxID=2527985 RepID=A0A5C6BT16_9PLAN|nr:PRC-barrel domain-containing protein [Symmachiella macrocystis]TWU14336.1 PRC-barrel domain protein [Symmachiella macrocystis]
MNCLKHRNPNSRILFPHFRFSDWHETLLFAMGLAILGTPLLLGDELRDADTAANTSRRGLADIKVTIDNGHKGSPEGPVSFDSEKAPSKSAWIFRSSAILNTPVVSETGQALGHVEELVINVRNGDVRYAAVELPTLLGREKLLAIPWNSLVLHRNEQGRLHFVVNIPLDKLKKAPGFDRDHWPNVGNRKWADEIAVYYGVIIKEGDLKSNFGTDVKALDQVPYLIRSKQMVEMPINDSEGETVGHVHDLLVDFATGSARYAICSLEEKSKQHKMIAIPLFVLEFQNDSQSPHFILTMERERLSETPSFEKSAWPNIREPMWSQYIDAFYQANLNTK